MSERNALTVQDLIDLLEQHDPYLKVKVDGRFIRRVRRESGQRPIVVLEG